MGKYSQKQTFVGARSPVRRGAEPKQDHPKIDWSAEVDARVDVPQAMIDHCGVVFARVRDTRKQLRARCPYPDCSSKEDSLSVWPHRSPTTKNHYHCRKCGKSGDIIKLIEDIKGLEFPEVLELLGLKDAPAQPRVRKETQADRDARELAAHHANVLERLRNIYPHMQQQLAAHDRPQVYLRERGIPLDQTQRFGVAYYPSEQETGRPLVPLTRKWAERIIFPLTGKDGLTFAGRTIRLWRPGMTPAQHKEEIKQWNKEHPEDQISRVIKTSPCGYSGMAEAEGLTDFVVCEGEIDRLSLEIAGVTGVVATGSQFDASQIPLSVETIIIAMDGDQEGKEASERMRKALTRYGFSVRQVSPDVSSDSKDWNDLLIAGQVATIRELFAAPAPAVDPQPEPEPEAPVSPAPDQADDGERIPANFDAAPDTCLDCGAHVSDERKTFFYWPITSKSDGPCVCYCTDCRIEDSGPTFITENSWPEPDYANLAFFDDGEDGDKPEPEQPSAPIKEPFRAETPALFLELAAIPRTYSKPFAAHKLVDGAVTQVGMHGRDPGQFWTMEEWAVLPAPAPEEDTPALVIALRKEDPIANLKAEFQAYANRLSRLFWKADMPGGYDNGLVARKVYLKRLKGCLESGNETMIGAAVHDMRVRLYGKEELRK